MQRLFDILFSGLALVVLSPLLIPLGIILRLTGEGESSSASSVWGGAGSRSAS
jgi:lipopolysaccharide/colanic/teichoic acid biosynthesis glycosyltransferase